MPDELTVQLAHSGGSLDLLYLTHYFSPEIGAPQTRLRETVRGLVELGHRVRVATGPPHYPSGRVFAGYRAYRPSVERCDGIPIYRLPMWPRPNRGFLDRVVDQGSFALAALSLVGVARAVDVVVVESPPLFLGLTATVLKRLAGWPFLFHVADPWPDFPVAMGFLRNRILRGGAYGIETVAYRNASLITTVTPGLVELLEAKPAARGKVRLLPNGVDTSRFDPGADARAARAVLGWPESGLTIVYAGTVGLAQGVGTLIEAAGPLASLGVTLHVVGDGADREALKATARERGYHHVRFEDPVQPSRVPTLLAAADLVAVLLREGPLYDHSLPTKLVEALAAGRPVLISAGGYPARLVSEHGAGLASPAECLDELRANILAALGSSERLLEMGRAARRLAEDSFDRTAVLRRLNEYLLEAVYDDRRRL